MVWKDNLSVARKIPNCIYLFNNHWAGTVVVEVRLSLWEWNIHHSFYSGRCFIKSSKTFNTSAQWIKMNKSHLMDQRDCLSSCLLHPAVSKCWMRLFNMWTLDSIQRIRSGCQPHLQHTTADCPCQMCLNYSVWFLQWQRRVESNIQAWGEEYEAATHRARRSHLREKAVFWICVQQQCEQVWICRTAFKPAYTKRSVPGLIPQTVTSMSLSKYKNWIWSSQEQTDEQFMMKVQDSQTR